MGSYEVRWKNSAERELRNLDPRHLPRIIKAVEALGDNPFPSPHRKLRGSEQNYRIRVGVYRVVYQVDPQGKIVTIYHVRHRSKAYRG